VKHRLPPWIVLVSLALLCALVIAGVSFVRMRNSSPAGLITRLPSDGAVIVSIDFRRLRKAGVLGILGGSRIGQDPEYRKFVDQTGFDYLNDLDAALICFRPNGTYFLLRGRFDWKALKDYAAHEGGECHNAFCTVEGSTPERMISFFPVYPSVMALAVGSDPSAAYALQTRRPARGLAIPDQPLWALIPLRAVAGRGDLPPASRLFVQALAGAESVVLSAGPSGDRWTIGLDASCATPSAATALTTQLRDVTAHLRDRFPTPDPRDLSGILAAGVFEQKHTHALGRWPVQREFLTALSGGAL
jgi:hypothetical protein